MEENNHSDDIMEENQGQPDNMVITDTQRLSIIFFGHIQQMCCIQSEFFPLCTQRTGVKHLVINQFVLSYGWAKKDVLQRSKS